jgi:hypothetical protein
MRRVGIAFILLLPILGGACSAEEIARRYAPIFYFEEKETCFPVDVSFHIQNSHLYQYTPEGPILINESISPSYLAEYSSKTVDSEYAYLDNVKGTVDDYESIIREYERQMEEYTVYSRIFSDKGITIIQYWMFYAFNKGELNRHEGDWEMVQIVLSNGTPTEVMYSQHYSGQKARWDQVEKEGEHIKVYVARGSHANYLRFYSGKFGVASDIVGANGKVLKPSDYNLEILKEQEWLNFDGRWGEFGGIEDFILGRAGPQGPAFRDNGTLWNDPYAWGKSLPQADNNIFLLEWFIYNFLALFVLFTLISLCLIGFRIHRRHKKQGLGPKIFSMLYIDGFNLKSLGNVICFIGIIIAIFALFNPWYTVSYRVFGDSNFKIIKTTGVADLIKIDGITGVQVHLPGSTGFVPVGTFSIPFSLLIALGFIFLFLATTGIVTSGKLGSRYIWGGIKLLSVVIIILVAVMALAAMVSSSLQSSDTSIEQSIKEVLQDIYCSPLGNQKTIYISEQDLSGWIHLKWGLGNGGRMLLAGGFVLILAGILEIAAKTPFFEVKEEEEVVSLRSNL